MNVIIRFIISGGRENLSASLIDIIVGFWSFLDDAVSKQAEQAITLKQ